MAFRVALVVKAVAELLGTFNRKHCLLAVKGRAFWLTDRTARRVYILFISGGASLRQIRKNELGSVEA